MLDIAKNINLSKIIYYIAKSIDQKYIDYFEKLRIKDRCIATHINAIDMNQIIFNSNHYDMDIIDERLNVCIKKINFLKEFEIEEKKREPFYPIFFLMAYNSDKNSNLNSLLKDVVLYIAALMHKAKDCSVYRNHGIFFKCPNQIEMIKNTEGIVEEQNEKHERKKHKRKQTCCMM